MDEEHVPAGAVTVLEPTRPLALSSTVAQTFDNTLAIVAKAAADPAVDVDKMKALLSMQERIMAKQAEISFNAALVALNNSGVLRVKKNGTVKLPGKGEYAFTKWEDMDRVIRPLLNENGLWLSFDTREREGGGVTTIATLKHADGHQQTATMSLPLDTGPGRNNLQAIGSTISYGKRYTTELLLNIVREDVDDDGTTGADIRMIAFEDAQYLEDLLTKTRYNRQAFFQQFNVTSTDRIRFVDFERARRVLEDAKRKIDAAAGGDRPRDNHPPSQPPAQQERPQQPPADPPTQQPERQPQQTQAQPEHDPRFPPVEAMTPEQRAGYDRRKISVPKVRENFLRAIAGTQTSHDIEALFGALDGTPGIGNASNIAWVNWLRHYEPDAYAVVRDAINAKLATFRKG